MAIEIGLLILLIVLNGVFAMSELAIASARRTRLQQWAADGNAGAAAALKLADEPNQFLATFQIGITLIGIVTGFFGGSALSAPVALQLSRVPALAPYSEAIAVLLVVGLVTYLSLVVGELVPKRLALQSPERLAAIVAPPMTVLSRVASPIVRLLGVSSEAILRVLGVRQAEDVPVTEEEIAILLQEGTAAGVFTPGEHELLEGVFDLGDRDVRDLMTPRYRVVALDLNAPMDENLHKMAGSPHHLFPVYEGDLDKLVGLVPVKKLWAASLSGEEIDLRGLAEPALILPESMPALDAVKRFQGRPNTAAMVVDEYGGVQGLLSLHDLVEAITGELGETPRNTGEAVQRADGSWLLDGALSVHEVRDLLQSGPLPGEESGDFETLGGFLMASLGRIPDVGDTVEWDSRIFEVVDMDGRRIDRVLVSG
ncbi:MAG: HlyC/CorC family transporter, partial [Thermomicrobiales bacterium]|nr:HlyC/CorC family transporter [Thermomicrobiales bacterium]